jgi:hypothetical protein
MNRGEAAIKERVPMTMSESTRAETDRLQVLAGNLGGLAVGRIATGSHIFDALNHGGPEALELFTSGVFSSG